MGVFSRREPSPLPPPYPGALDSFSFTERLAATVSAPEVAKPPLARGHVRVEALDSSGSILAMDTWQAPQSAPSGSWLHEGIPATFIRDGVSDARYQELMLPAGKAPPFSLPPHLAKPGVEHYRILWSCDA